MYLKAIAHKSRYQLLFRKFFWRFVVDVNCDWLLKDVGLCLENCLSETMSMFSWQFFVRHCFFHEVGMSKHSDLQTGFLNPQM